MPTSLIGTTYPLPAGAPNLIRLDVILIHADGTKGVETVTVDMTEYPTNRERFNQAGDVAAHAIRVLYAWKKAGMP